MCLIIFRYNTCNTVELYDAICQISKSCYNIYDLIRCSSQVSNFKQFLLIHLKISGRPPCRGQSNDDRRATVMLTSQCILDRAMLWPTNGSHQAYFQAARCCECTFWYMSNTWATSWNFLSRLVGDSSGRWTGTSCQYPLQLCTIPPYTYMLHIRTYTWL